MQKGESTENQEIFDKERREGHVQIHKPHMKRDKETSKNTILRFNVCEDEGTGLEHVIKNIGVDEYKGNIIGEK